MANIKKSQKKSQQPQEENIEVQNENVVLDVSQVDDSESQQPQEENIEVSIYKDSKFIINNNKTLLYPNFDDKKNNIIDYTDLSNSLKDKKNIDTFISLLLKIKHIELYIW